MSTWTAPSHCDPAAPASGQLRAPPYPGFGNWIDPGFPRHGAIIWLNGLQGTPFSRLKPADQNLTLPATAPMFGGDVVTGFLPGYGASFNANVANDQWALFNVSLPEFNSNVGFPPNIPSTGLQNDFATDPAFGARYNNTMANETVRHAITGAQQKFGSSVPIIIAGGSHGGSSALLAISNFQSEIIAGAVFFPLTLWCTLDSQFNGPGPSFAATNTSGADIGPNQLTSIPSTLPVFYQYGTVDQAVGWSQTTVAAGSIGANSASLTSFTVVDGTQLVQAQGLVRVPTNSALGYAVLSFTTITGNVVSGCVNVFGSGLLIAGAVVQSESTQIVSNALAASPARNVTDAHVVNANHGMPAITAGLYFGLAGPTALSSLGTLTLNSQIFQGQTFITNQTQIRDTVGNWHTIAFTGIGTTTVGSLTVTTLIGCTYSGNTSATVSLGSPVVSSGGASPMSFLYWLKTFIDPNYLAVF